MISLRADHSTAPPARRFARAPRPRPRRQQRTRDLPGKRRGSRDPKIRQIAAERLEDQLANETAAHAAALNLAGAAARRGTARRGTARFSRQQPPPALHPRSIPKGQHIHAARQRSCPSASKPERRHRRSGASVAAPTRAGRLPQRRERSEPKRVGRQVDAEATSDPATNSTPPPATIAPHAQAHGRQSNRGHRPRNTTQRGPGDASSARPSAPPDSSK